VKQTIVAAIATTVLLVFATLVPLTAFAQREIDTTQTELNTTTTVIQDCKQALTVTHDITHLHECATFLDAVHTALNSILNDNSDLVNAMLTK
jgi:hypothetical protein